VSVLHPQSKLAEAFLNEKRLRMMCKNKPHYKTTMLKACWYALFHASDRNKKLV